MTAVLVSRFLAEQYGTESAIELASGFRDYKKNQYDEYGFIYGKDKGFLYPEIVVTNGLKHVHMYQPCVDKRWEKLLSEGAEQDAFTSNRMLVYGQMLEVSYTPYLLLTILDPAGHEQMKDIERMRAIGAEYEDEAFAYSARLPSDAWIFVK